MLLGFLPDEFLQGFAGALLDKQPAPVLDWVKRLSDEGWDLPQFVRDFREYLRETLVDQLAAGAKPEALSVAGKTVSLAELLQMIKVMGQTQDDMRWNDNPRLVLELYSLRLTQPFVDAGELLRRMEGLEQGKFTTPSPLVGEGRDGGLKQSASAPPPSPSPTRGQGKVMETSQESSSQWKQLLAELWKRPLVGSQMERARLQSASDKEWVIALPDKFAVDLVSRSQALIQETLAKIIGHPVNLRFIQGGPAPANEADDLVVTPSPQERLDERQTAVMKDAGVQKILHAFKGRIRPEST